MIWNIFCLQRSLWNKAEHDSESPASFYEFTCENTHKYHTHVLIFWMLGCRSCSVQGHLIQGWDYAEQGELV
jgi:hypothetical protein